MKEKHPKRRETTYLMDPIIGVFFVASLATNDGNEWLM
jgi:hypothetical protein